MKVHTTGNCVTCEKEVSDSQILRISVGKGSIEVAPVLSYSQVWDSSDFAHVNRGRL